MNIDFKVENSEQLEELFKQLNLFEQNSLVKQALNEAATPILDQAKSNFLSRLKGETYNTSAFNKSFVSSQMKNKAGMIIGIDNYKYRWVEWGTKLRKTGGRTRGNTFKPKKDKLGNASSSHSTGIAPASHFFFDAVKSRQNESAEALTKGIIASMEQILNNKQK